MKDFVFKEECLKPYKGSFVSFFGLGLIMQVVLLKIEMVKVLNRVLFGNRDSVKGLL